MGWYMFSGRARVTPKIKGLRLQRAMFFDILKVGAVSCFSPIQSVLTISIFTHMLAGFGAAVLAGYGIGARLEFLLTSLSFSFGIASVPMIGMAIGGGNVARARRVAWTAGSMSFIAVGGIAVVIAVFPDLWVNIFTRNEGVLACEPAISLDGGALVRLHWAGELDVFLLARCGPDDRPRAGADGAAGVHRARRLLADGARRERAGILRACGRIDGGAGRVVLRQRHPDALGTTRERGLGAAGPVGRRVAHSVLLLLRHGR